MTQLRTIDRRGVTDSNPFPVTNPDYEGVDGQYQVTVVGLEELIDVLERLQQQFSIVTGVNLTKGERLD